MKTEKPTLKKLTCNRVVLLTLSVLGLSGLQGQEPLNTTIERDTSVVYQPMSENFDSVSDLNRDTSTLNKFDYDYFLDLNRDTINDFKFTYTILRNPDAENDNTSNYYTMKMRIQPLDNNRVIGSASSNSTDLDALLMGFNTDTEISGVLGSEYNWVNSSRVIQGYSQNQIGETGTLDDEGFFKDVPSYAGLEFNIEGQTHYGWILMDFSLREGWLEGEPDPNFLGYAYETEAGASIMTGEIPEPSTYSLWVGIVSALTVVISKRFKILK